MSIFIVYTPNVIMRTPINPNVSGNSFTISGEVNSRRSGVKAPMGDTIETSEYLRAFMYITLAIILIEPPTESAIQKFGLIEGIPLKYKMIDMNGIAKNLNDHASTNSFSSILNECFESNSDEDFRNAERAASSMPNIEVTFTYNGVRI